MCEVIENIDVKKLFMTLMTLIRKKETSGPNRRELAWSSQLDPRVCLLHVNNFRERGLQAKLL